jgi:DNA-binding NtrC family response regulator/tetratricopeptide (TPR) repeat protein
MSNVSACKSVAILVELRQFIDGGQYQAAADLVTELDQTRFAFEDSIDNARLISLKSEIHYRRAEYAQALAEAQDGLTLVITTGENELIAQLQSTAAQSLTELGNISEAERVYRDLVSTYRRLDNSVGVIRTLNRLSRVCFIKSQFDKAVECLLEADDYARNLGERKWLAMIKGNLGTIFNLTGEFHNAVEFLTESASLNRCLDNRLNLCRSHLSLAYAQMHLFNFREAEENLDVAAALVDGGCFAAERVSLAQYRAQLALLRSDPATALEHATLALDRARESASAGASVCQLNRLVAEAHYRNGNYNPAQRAVSNALDLARRIDQKTEIGACLRLLGMIAHEQGQQAKAEQFLAEAIAQLALSGARFELASTHLIWSRLSADHLTRSEHRHLAERLLASLKLDRLYLKQPRTRQQDRRDDVELVGEDPAFLDLVRQARFCSDSDIPVLLLGETGSGKDQFARYIHQHSERNSHALIQVNCAAIPIELAESELFGYEKGAFTNASESKIGLIEAADGGTLFLNEIGELPVRLQAKLLAALEEKRFFKLGGTAARKVNFRLVAATNVDLMQAVRDGKFRSDLYYRLAVMTLQVPLLSDRGDDSFRLFKYFMELDQIDLESVSNGTLNTLRERCRRYGWPGNVRELKNHVELFCLTEHRDAEAICRRLIARLEPTVVEQAESKEPLSLPEEVERFEKSLIGQALGTCGGVIRRAADFLGLPEATLRSKMKKYRMTAA